MFRRLWLSKIQRLSSSGGCVWPSLAVYRKAAESSLKSVVQLKGATDKEGLTLFSVARNEADRFPDFLDHYRRLGVERIRYC